MTTSIPVPLLSEPTRGPLKKKRVLLVDASPTKRDMRAEVMRKLGMEVDCAADISEARSWWRADLYNLVLMNVDNDLGHRDRFCEDLRGATPPQQLAFLVGKPEYLADSPNGEFVALAEADGDRALVDEARAALAVGPAGALPQRWGILEASRRISAVRSLSHVRSKAISERPKPARDSEIRQSRRTTESRTLDDLLREEM